MLSFSVIQKNVNILLKKKRCLSILLSILSSDGCDREDSIEENSNEKSFDKKDYNEEN